MQSYISKVTSRGQITLPQEFREEEGITEKDYVVMKKQGNVLVLAKVDNVMDEITKEFQREARRRGITKKSLLEELQKVRKARNRQK